MDQSAGQVDIMLDVVRDLARTVDGNAVSIAVLGVLFLAWVVTSKRRTRHFVALVRAWRGPARPTVTSSTPRRGQVGAGSDR